MRSKEIKSRAGGSREELRGIGKFRQARGRERSRNPGQASDDLMFYRGFVGITKVHKD